MENDKESGAPMVERWRSLQLCVDDVETTMKGLNYGTML